SLNVASYALRSRASQRQARSASTANAIGTKGIMSQAITMSRRCKCVALSSGQHRRVSAALPTPRARQDWQQHGREVFKRVRRERASYLKVCAMLVPKELKFEHSGGVKEMTDEQLERGIELIKEMLAQREAGTNAKVIEGEAEVVPSLPAPGSGGTKMPKAEGQSLQKSSPFNCQVYDV